MKRDNLMKIMTKVGRPHKCIGMVRQVCESIQSYVITSSVWDDGHASVAFPLAMAQYTSVHWDVLSSVSCSCSYVARRLQKRWWWWSTTALKEAHSTWQNFKRRQMHSRLYIHNYIFADNCATNSKSHVHQPGSISQHAVGGTGNQCERI